MPTVASSLRTRVANELHCPRETIVIEALGASTYRVHACKHVGLYVCERRGWTMGGEPIDRCQREASPSAN